MFKYILKRIGAMIITLFVILTIGFLLVRLVPGSPYGSDPEMSQATIDALDAKYHFNEPLIVQYGYYLGNVLHGDFGTSTVVRPSAPVWDMVVEKIPVTLQVNLVALICAIPFGILFGTLAAIKKNTIVDHLISLMVVLFASVPSFVVASLLQYWAAYKRGWFPIIYDANGLTWFTRLYSAALPMIALALNPVAKIVRFLRGELGEIMNSDYLLLARAKGLTYSRAIIRHGMRNAFVPLVNVIIPMFATVIGGSLAIENIFAIPGMGALLVKSIHANDHFLTVAVIVFYAAIYLIAILLVDISYGLIDPRIRIGGEK